MSSSNHSSSSMGMMLSSSGTKETPKSPKGDLGNYKLCTIRSLVIGCYVMYFKMSNIELSILNVQ